MRHRPVFGTFHINRPILADDLKHHPGCFAGHLLPVNLEHVTRKALGGRAGR